MIGMDHEGSFNCQFVAIPPFELGLPVQVRAASVRDQKLSRQRDVGSYSGHEAVVGGLIRSNYVSVSSFEHQGSVFCIVRIEAGDSLQLEDGLHIHLKAWPSRKLGGVTAVPVVFVLVINAKHLGNLEVGVDFRQELNRV